MSKTTWVARDLDGNSHTLNCRFVMDMATLNLVCFRDIGPWDKYKTITNDMDAFAPYAHAMAQGRAICVTDSHGDMDLLEYDEEDEFTGWIPVGSRDNDDEAEADEFKPHTVYAPVSLEDWADPAEAKVEVAPRGKLTKGIKLPSASDQWEALHDLLSQHDLTADAMGTRLREGLITPSDEAASSYRNQYQPTPFHESSIAKIASDLLGPKKEDKS